MTLVKSERNPNTGTGVGTSPVIEFSSGTNVTSISRVVRSLGGRLVGIEVEAPNLTTDTTFTATVNTLSGSQLVQKTGIVDNSTTYTVTFSDNIFVPVGCQVVLSWTTSQTISTPFYVLLHLSSGG